MSEKNAVALGQLWGRLLFEDQVVPSHVDAVYLHGLSEGMVASCDLFGCIQQFMRLRKASFVSYNGSDGRGMPPQDKPGSAWPGSGWYWQELVKNRGVSSLVPTRDGLNTRDECDALAELARDRGWRTVFDVTVPYHWPRVLACMVGAMAHVRYLFSIYFLRPGTPHWGYSMVGSQGTKQISTYHEESGDDVLRLFKYWEKGREGNEGNAWHNAWGAPPEEIFRYLDWRDGIARMSP